MQTIIIYTWVSGDIFLNMDETSLSIHGQQLAVHVNDGNPSSQAKHSNFGKCELETGLKQWAVMVQTEHLYSGLQNDPTARPAGPVNLFQQPCSQGKRPSVARVRQRAALRSQWAVGEEAQIPAALTCGGSCLKQALQGDGQAGV